MKRLLLLSGLALAACSSTGTVELAGQFSIEAPPASEVRVMLDPHFGHIRCSGKDHQGDERAFVSVHPHEDGDFTTGRIEVDFLGKMSDPPPPTFFLAFENDKGLLYAVGERSARFAYRTYDAETREPVPRSNACWKILRGTYTDAGKRQTVLTISLAPNYDTDRRCLPEGNFTPLGLESLDLNPEDSEKDEQGDS